MCMHACIIPSTQLLLRHSSADLSQPSTFDSSSLIMHKNLPRSRLSGLSINLAYVVPYCLHAGCLRKAAKIEKKYGRVGSAEIKRVGA